MWEEETKLDNTVQNKVNYQFKILYAVGMILVVANHIPGNGGVSLFYEFFPAYGFHIGLFVFASGYFYREGAENSVILYIKKKLKTLILPLYLWNFVYSFFAQLMSVRGFSMGIGVSFKQLIIDPITSGHQYVYNLATWFVVPLFMTEIVNVLFRKLLFFIKTKKEYVCLLCALVAGMVGIYLASEGYNTGWWIVLTRLLYFIPFYSAGHFYKIILEKHDTLPNFLYFFVVVAFQLCIIIYKGVSPTYVPSWSQFAEFSCIPYAVGFLGIAFWLRICRILEPAIGRSKVINAIADNSFSIMVHQFLGFMLVKSFYATGYRYTDKLFQDFDWNAYHTDIWYYYTPKGLPQTLIIYVFVSIALAIIIQRVIDKTGAWVVAKMDGKKGAMIKAICFVTLLSLLLGGGVFVSRSVQRNGGVTIPVMNNYQVGKELYFDKPKANASKYCASGFSYNEESFTWTDGLAAVMSFTISDKNLVLEYTCAPFNGSQHIILYANDLQIADYILTAEGDKKVSIPPECLGSGALNLRFELPDARSPKELGMGEDSRTLGIAMKKLAIKAAE